MVAVPIRKVFISVGIYVGGSGCCKVAARLGNLTFLKNGKQRVCKIPKIYGAVEKMPRTSYVRYSAQSVHKTEYIGHGMYSTPHKTGKCQTNNIGR